MNEELFNLLNQFELHISFAESCTGGMLCSKFVDTPGVSDVLNESYVTYSENAKNKILGVDLGIIKKYGVVSREVAYEMASGLKKISNADVCISITGLAEENGYAYVGYYVFDSLIIERIDISGITDRNEIRAYYTSEIMKNTYNLLQTKLKEIKR